MKKQVEKNVPVSEVQVNCINETLKFVESEEMKKHLLQWLTSGKVRRLVEVCAEIVFYAPVPLEAKLATLKLLKQADVENSDIEDMICSVQRAISECGEASDGAEYKLYLYKPPVGCNEDAMKFKSFDEVVAYIKALNQKADDAMSNWPHDIWTDQFKTLDESVTHIKFVKKEVDAGKSESWNNPEYYEYSIVYDVEKWIPGSKDWSMYWYLNEEGEAIYFEGAEYGISSSCFTVPFQPGDIVMTDCRPFGKKKPVLILENVDSLGSTSGGNVTCLFFNKHGKLAVGYFHSNEFSSEKLSIADLCTTVSAMYRAETYTGELSERETPLRTIGEAIKKNPKLGSAIFRKLDTFRFLATGLFTDSGSKVEYRGIEWTYFEQWYNL